MLKIKAEYEKVLLDGVVLLVSKSPRAERIKLVDDKNKKVLEELSIPTRISSTEYRNAYAAS